MALVFEAAKEAESHGGYEKHGPDKSPSQGREGAQDGSLGCWLYMFLDLYVCMYANSLKWCPSLCNPMDYSPPWDSPAKNTGVGSHALQGDLQTQGSNRHLLRLRRILYI